MVAPTPVVTADWFAARIATLREASGRTPGELAAALGRSASGVRHFESSTRLVGRRYLTLVLEELGHGHLVGPYSTVIDRSRARTLWWQQILPQVKRSEKPAELHQLELLVNFESSATAICCYAPHTVPDLVQTPGYAEALHRIAEPALPELHRALLPGRRAILDQDEPPELTVIIDESVLCREIGGPDVLTEQLARLDALAERPGVTIRIVPSDAATGVEGNFSLLELTAELDDDPGAVFVKTAADWVHFREPGKVARYRARWSALLRHALPLEQSRETIGRLLRRRHAP
ncbi:helix-turn-helix domain-containing protein [Prauserella cavernicola]|uniref:Helix-turn-helix domain-containing protein n=1 Tax=Prauserella cavernicola TaxID=2800127 RepID=A0A934QXT3_9PSEU|nr:helix-turn-helix transcriptional regulator [Prauserella cavernicola]MBK1788436.1 helix-turn-helix domain-containing protein [Prauserella cavernicola]